jgi:hypothetical protein
MFTGYACCPTPCCPACIDAVNARGTQFVEPDLVRGACSPPVIRISRPPIRTERAGSPARRELTLGSVTAYPFSACR